MHRIGTVFAILLATSTIDTTGITIYCRICTNMPVSPHQVNNVLRVYGDQLCQGKISNQPENADAGEPDRISISAKTRRETIIDGIASNIIKRIAQSEPHDKVETEVFKNLESELGEPAAIHEDRRNKLIFKEIDENAEFINSLSIEDSKFLIDKLRVITLGNQGGKK
jgi:hypothetical protein